METADNNIEKLEKKLQKARETFNKKQIIKILYKLFKAYNDSKKYHKLINIGKELCQFHRIKGEKKMEAGILFEMGIILNKIADYENSSKYLKTALTIYQELNDPLQTVTVYSQLGDIESSLGNYNDGLVYLLAAVKIFEKNIMLQEESENKMLKIRYAELLNNIGIIYGKLKHFEKGRIFHLRALEINENLNILPAISQILSNLGVSYSKEDLNKSLEYYKKALKIAEKLDSKTFIAIYTNNIGAVYEDLEDYKKAHIYYKKALNIAEKHNIIKYKPFFLESVGSIYFKMKKYDSAIQYITQSLKLSQKQKIREQVQKDFELLSNIYDKKKDYKTALSFYRKYSAEKDKMLNKEMIGKISGLEKKIEENSKKVTELKKHNSLISTALKNTIHMDLIGNSKKIRKVLELATTAAAYPYTNVLILGESGTGKEIIAHIIHYASIRKEHLFVAVNTSSTPDSLAESEFFGHLKGSFTGALTDKTGYLELADKGTLFLDEIADTPISLQAKLLRVLENKRIKKIGSGKEIQVDFRIIAATNKDINELVEINKFRLDLLYRINTIIIKIPPLRERTADIEPLLDYFINKFSKILKKPVPKVNAAVIDKLKKYHFPGNVRELKNMVEKAMIMLKSNTLEPELFNFKQYIPEEEIKQQANKSFNIEDIEKHTILEALKKTNQNRDEALKLLGISRSTLFRKLKKYKI